MVKIFSNLWPGMKSLNCFPGLRTRAAAKQVTLLADTVASGGFEFRGIDDRAGARIGKVLLRGAVAAFAGNRFRAREHGRAVMFKVSEMCSAVPEWQRTHSSRTGRVKSGSG